MRSIITLIAMILSFSSYASTKTELNRFFDGLSVACETKYDTFVAKRTNVYSLSNPIIIKVNSDEVVVTLDISFYDCNEVDGKFVFSKLEEHMNATYISLNRNEEIINVYREDLHKEVAAFTENFDVAALSDKIVNGTKKVSLLIPIANLDINTFSQAQEKGEFYTTLYLRTKTRTYTSEIDLGSRLVGSGAFRLFFDLNKNKAQF